MTFKFKCGVDPAHYTKYEFNNHIWLTGVDQRNDLVATTEYVAHVGEDWWVRNSRTGAWERRKEKAARQDVENTLLGQTLPTGDVVTMDVVDAIFTGRQPIVPGSKDKKFVGSAPVLSGSAVLPMCPTYVTFDGHHHLNIWRNHALIGKDEDVGPEVLMLLYLIWGSLCAQDVPFDDPLPFAESLLFDILEDRWTNPEFQFVMNWLAAIYQFPGINLQTNLWLTGATQGIGKGTIFAVMRQIIGSEYCTALDQKEIERGWANTLRGKMLVLGDEFDAESGDIDWDKWIKRNTCETYVDFAERNVGNVKSLNIANYMFLTNQTQPLKISFNDRRNVFIATTNDPNWKAVAKSFNTDHMDRCRDKILSGFAWVLSQIKVDLKFTNSALQTHRKQAIQEGSMTSVEAWVNDDVSIRGRTMLAKDAYEAYQVWCECNGAEEVNKTVWGNSMKKVCEYGWARKLPRTSQGFYYQFPQTIAKKDLSDGLKAARAWADAVGSSTEPYTDPTPLYTEDHRSGDMKRLQAQLRNEKAASEAADMR